MIFALHSGSHGRSSSQSINKAPIGNKENSTVSIVFSPPLLLQSVGSEIHSISHHWTPQKPVPLLSFPLVPEAETIRTPRGGTTRDASRESCRGDDCEQQAVFQNHGASRKRGVNKSASDPHDDYTPPSCYVYEYRDERVFDGSSLVFFCGIMYTMVYLHKMCHFT